MTIRHEIEELALLHAFGVLDGSAKHAFEAALSAGSAEHLQAFQRAGELLVAIETAGAMETPSSLDARVAAMAAELVVERQAEGSEAGVELTRQVASQLEGWVKTPYPGCSYRVLYRNPEANSFTYLFRMEPGSRVPPHRHGNAAEQCWVLEGDVESAGVVARAGDFFVAARGTTHDWITTVNGNLQLIVGPTELEYVS